jgi:hypothetical protein
VRTAWMLPVVVLLGACASSPKAPETSPPPAAAAEAAPTRVAAAPPADSDLGDITAANIAEAQAAGYKVVNDKGSTMFCKKTLLTGTRLKYVTTCLTAAQWRQTTEEAKEGLSGMQGNGTFVDSPTNPLGR